MSLSQIDSSSGNQREMNRPLITASGDNVVSFGKHKNRKFEDLYRNEKRYCQWVMEVEPTIEGMRQLQAWLKKKKEFSNVPKADAEPIKLLKQSFTTQMGSLPRRRKKTRPFERDDNDDDSYDRNDSDDGYGVSSRDHLQPPRKKQSRLSNFLRQGIETAYMEDELEELCTAEDLEYARAEQGGWPPRKTSKALAAATALNTADLGGGGLSDLDDAVANRPLVPRLSSSKPPAVADSTSKTTPVMEETASMGNSQVDSGWIDSTKLSQGSGATKEITAQGTMVLEVFNEDYVRVLYDSGNGRESKFVPRQIFSFLANFRVNNAADGMLVPCNRYGELIQALKKGVNMETTSVRKIPDFVLRAFPTLNVHAARKVLNPRCAYLLLRAQSPRTQKLVPQGIDHLLGPLLSQQLKPFQREGIEFGLKHNGRCLIGDEMGLGKTLQALGILAVYNAWPALIVCPSSIRFQWKDQATRWLVHCFSDPAKEILVIRSGRQSLPNLQQLKIIITSYELLCRMPQLHCRYAVMVCDESHYLKSAQAKRSQRIVPMLQQASRAILLSGTPALNKPSELYQQLSALMPDFSEFHEFASRYCHQRVNPWSRRQEYFGARLPDELNTFITGTVMIRRLKRDVQKELPPKLRSKVPVEVSPAALRDIQFRLKGMSTRTKGLLGLEVDDNDSGAADKENRNEISQLFKMTGDAKAPAVAEYVEYVYESIEVKKLLVFAHHKSVLDVLEGKMKMKNISYVRIDGSTSMARREEYVKSFQEDTVTHVALLSVTACGHGLNFTAAGTSVFAELYWVPGQILQAEDRTHRMGSGHSTVNVHYCIAEGTADDLVWRVLCRKWESVSSTLDGATERLAYDEDRAKFDGHSKARPKIREQRGSICIVEDNEGEQNEALVNRTIKAGPVQTTLDDKMRISKTPELVSQSISCSDRSTQGQIPKEESHEESLSSGGEQLFGDLL